MHRRSETKILFKTHIMLGDSKKVLFFFFVFYALWFLLFHRIMFDIQNHASHIRFDCTLINVTSVASYFNHRVRCKWYKHTHTHTNANKAKWNWNDENEAVFELTNYHSDIISQSVIITVFYWIIIIIIIIIFHGHGWCFCI